MSVRTGCGLSVAPDPQTAATEAATAARAGLGAGRPHLAFVFACGAHLGDPLATLEGVHEGLAPEALVGCGAAGVLGAGREVEDGDAVAVWAADLGDGHAATFHAAAREELGDVVVDGLPDVDGASGVVLLPDPWSFPTPGVLATLAETAPGVPVLGGLASARTPQDATPLFCDRSVLADGAVGVRLDGVELLPCVSQGATPLGPELTVTAAEGNVIAELAGRPALETLRQVVGDLPGAEQRMLAGGLLLGVVVAPNKPDYEQGDFLVRGLVGADPDAGTVVLAGPVVPGQVVRLHARDARTADRDLRDALGLRLQALGRPPAGALVFTCNGRGTEMFGSPDHDAGAVQDELGGAPAAGFHAAGEIGPVGGESFLHGFTATVAVFGR